MIHEWLGALDKNNPGAQLILAHRNADVQALNALARAKLIEAGELGKSGAVVSAIRQDKEVSLELAPNDRLLFLRNNSALNVKNGELATVVAVKGDTITVRRDGDKSTLTFSTDDYKDFDYGYAATVHKTQGVTLDRAFVYAGGAGWNRHLAYVALTRHRDSVSVYASRQDYADISDLKTAFGRDEFRDNVLDFPLSYAERRGFDADSLIGRFIDRVAGVKDSVKNAWLFVSNYEAYLLNKAQKVRDLTREDRALAKRTASYIDQVHALNHDRTTLSKELGKAMYGDARYVDLMARLVSLNRDAYELWENKNRFGGDTSLDNVLARHRYSATSFEKAVLAHKNWLVMARYLESYEKGLGAVRRSQAHAMAKASESFALFSYACQSRGLQVRDVQRQLREDVTSVDRTRFVHGLDADQKQPFKTFERYLSATEGLKAEWRDSYARDAEPTISEKWRIQGFTELRDRLAMQIAANPESYRGALHFYDIDADKLVKQGEAHSRRDVVKSLERLVSAVDRREAAHQVLADRANYRYVFEQNGDWKEIAKLSREHEHTLFLQGLSTDERRAYELLSRYQRARVDAARAWTTYFYLKNKGRENLDSALKNARDFNERRNHLADELVVNQKSTARFIEKTSIPMTDIQKQAKQHHAHMTHHLQKIHAPSLDIPLDEKTIESGFNDLVDEWKRVDEHYHPTFKGLAESHQRLSNDKLPESLMASFQKTYDKHLEKIYTTPTLLKELEKIAPNVSKIINTQGSKIYGLKVDWLSPKLDNEWQALSQSNHERIKKFAQDRYILKTTSDTMLRDHKLRFLNESISKLVSDKNCYAELLNKAPNLSKQMQQYHERAKERDRGISR